MSNKNLQKLFASSHLCLENIAVPDVQDPLSIPQIDENYIFELPLLNQLLLYLAYPQKDCLFLSGPAGCGKTSLALQTAARLGWGVEQLTLSSRTEACDLIGHATLRRGELVYEYGPLVRAMRDGEILILNEIDLMPPGELAALNDVLEGRALTVTQNFGERIVPSPFFRVIATANTKGMGDTLGFYNGTRQLNQAFLDRWRFVDVNYPNTRAEKSILDKSCPVLGAELVEKLVQFAQEVRRTSCPEQGRASLSAPFSTRALVRVGQLLCVCPKLSVERAIETAFAARLPQDEREYVMRLCRDIFGNGDEEDDLMGRKLPQSLAQTLQDAVDNEESQNNLKFEDKQGDQEAVSAFSQSMLC